MKLSILILAALVLPGQIFSQENPVTLGHIDSIQSRILGEKRAVWIHVPNNDPGGLFSKTKYPVVYLLDGDAHFYYTAGIIHQLSSVNANSLVPEMIVVGITNTDRTRDLTPTHVATDQHTGDSTIFKTSGGGERFLFFLEKELMPYIDSAYPTLPHRTLIGHSFGGLLAIHALTYHSHLFNNYIAIDPSMWWDDRKLLREAATRIKSGQLQDRSLFMAIANTMAAGMDTLKVLKDTTLATDHIRSILEFNNAIKRTGPGKLDYASRYYSEDSHGSVPLISTHDGLRSVFRFYDFRLQPADFMNFSQETIDRVEAHFHLVSKRFGFRFPPPEPMINQLGYLAMSQGKQKEAEYLFRLNISNYPGSFNVYDSMGDFYHSQGEKDRARESFLKALSLKEFPATRNKLEQLDD